MPQVLIRPSVSADVQVLIALDTVVPNDPARAEAIADWVESNACFVAESDGKPAGYGVVSSHFFGRPMLEMVMVAIEVRRQSIGAALIEHAVANCAGPQLWTSTNQSNLPMQALLDRLGFRRAGIVEGLDDGDPEIIFRRDIATPS